MLIEGSSKIYPLLPISIGVLALSYLLSLLVSFLFDLFYDLYLIKFSKIPEKTLVQQRVKNDLQRLKTYFKNDKMEQFDEKAAKTRLTIINRLLNERIYSKESSPFADAIAAKLNSKMREKAEKINQIEPAVVTKPTFGNKTEIIKVKDSSNERNEDSKETDQVKVS